MKITRKIIKIDESKCDGCGLCEKACAEGAIKIIDGKAKLISEAYCDGLGVCIGECPLGAITIEERPAEKFSEEAVKEHSKKMSQASVEQMNSPCECCPGSTVKTIKVAERPNIPINSETGPSQLSSWPIQLMLVPPIAPYLKGADLLITSDCTPFAIPDFHQRYLKGRIPLMGCPKLDDLNFYKEKMKAIFEVAHPRSVTVLRMEVPCCAGIAHVVLEARDEIAPHTPVEIHTIRINGEILADCHSAACQTQI